MVRRLNPIRFPPSRLTQLQDRSQNPSQNRNLIPRLSPTRSLNPNPNPNPAAVVARQGVVMAAPTRFLGSPRKVAAHLEWMWAPERSR